MAAVKGRRQRRSVEGVVAMNTRVQPEHLQKARTAADALGVSLATYVDQLLARDQLDAAGRPVWWAETPPAHQELPLKSA